MHRRCWIGSGEPLQFGDQAVEFVVGVVVVHGCPDQWGKATRSAVEECAGGWDDRDIDPSAAEGTLDRGEVGCVKRERDDAALFSAEIPNSRGGDLGVESMAEFVSQGLHPVCDRVEPMVERLLHGTEGAPQLRSHCSKRRAVGWIS